MPRPAAWATVPITARYAELFDDLPAGAAVLFTTEQVVVCAGVTVFGGRQMVALDADFELVTTLPASDDPGLNITPVIYHVREMWRGGRQFDFTAPIASAGTGVDLATVAPLPDPVTGENYTPGPAGPSAYAVAVAAGFVGTEAQWLASLEGESGTAATFAFGTTSTGAPGTSASVAEAAGSTPQARVYDLIVPRGNTGANSTVPGPSAYDVAIAAGFSGTESKWLASLKGDTGPAGTVGDEYAAVITVDTGSVALGVYPVAQSVRGTGTLGRIYASILSGTGSATVQLMRNGAQVGGDVTVSAGTPVTAAASATLALGDTLAFAVVAATNVAGLWLQTDGGAP